MNAESAAEFFNNHHHHQRTTTEAFSLRPAYVPYHSFSQLASSKSGMEILIKHSEIHDMLSKLHNANDKHWIKIKAAIWGNNYST